MIHLIAQATSGEVDPAVLIVNTLLLLARYLHIVCTTLLVGGTLFYEMVVPIAIADLKDEHQYAIFARARLVFKRIVWGSALLLVISGVSSSYRHWKAYSQPDQVAIEYIRATATQPTTQPPPEISGALQPGWWWAAHASTGFVAILIAVFLTAGRSPPAQPVQWMRLNLVILMIVIFLASATRHVRIAATEPDATRQPEAPRTLE